MASLVQQTIIQRLASNPLYGYIINYNYYYKQITNSKNQKKKNVHLATLLSDTIRNKILGLLKQRTNHTIYKN